MSKKHKKQKRSKKVDVIKDNPKIKPRTKVEKIWNSVMKILTPIAVITLILSALLLIILAFFKAESTTSKGFFIGLLEMTNGGIAIITTSILILLIFIDSIIDKKQDVNPLLLIFIICSTIGSFAMIKINMDWYSDIPQAKSQQYTTYVGIIEYADFYKDNKTKTNAMKILKFKIDNLKFSSSHKDIINSIKYKGKYRIKYLENSKYVIDVEYLGNE